MSRAFESSSAGRLPADATLECGVCWWVYDPAIGDEAGDIPPGAAFSDLPDAWRCPSCDADRSKFMVIEGSLPAAPCDGAESQDQRVASLVQAFEAVEDNMIGLPVHNARLVIEAVGFRPYNDGYIGVLNTPWSMNLVWIPAEATAGPAGALGAARSHIFPSGAYSFLIGRMDGFGTLETCSLFSPMDEFDDPSVAREAGIAAINGLFAPPPEEKPKQVSRRFLLTINGEPR